jgi:hypothetical protein
MTSPLKIVVDRHPDGYLAYSLGLARDVAALAVEDDPVIEPSKPCVPGFLSGKASFHFS